jgi:hypothetical protein
MNKQLIIILTAVIFLGAIGFIANKIKMTGVSKAIKGTDTVMIDIWLDEVPTTNGSFLRNGQKASLIIRNRPHGDLEIVESKCVPLSTDRFYLRRVSIPTKEAETVTPFDEPFLYQCRLLLKDDQAIHTSSGGYLSHGNPLKTGNRISLEGTTYRVDGFIVDLKPVKK